VTRTAARVGAVGSKKVAGLAVRRAVKLPEVEHVPEGRMVTLPGRGQTFLVDVEGPTADAPTIVLLPALGCTAYLCWFATLAELSRTHRVITFDQRWHGRGIRSPRFRLDDCADDVVAVLDVLGIDKALVAGYSLGGAVAQVTWHRHPERVAGLVLGSTARNYRGHKREKFFFSLMTLAMHPLSRVAESRVERVAQALSPMPSVQITDSISWGAGEFRSTSAWSMPEVLGELGRFNSAAWIGDVDVPAAVVVTARDRVIPVRRQRKLAGSIEGATVYEAPGGHASVVMDHDRWVPVFLEAVADVSSRIPGPEQVAV
jgi:pimeloyl-ACP methyl ester carboxylesterase